MALFNKIKSDTDQTPVLLHPPLLEVIFELRWEIFADQQSQRMRDPSYPAMYGQIFERLKKDFPASEDLPSTNAHPEMTPYVPRHRIRKEKEGYPLVQIGPGILTVNAAKSYSWESFAKLCNRVVESLIDLFPKEELALNFIKAELRYVNGINFDIAKENPLSFLADKLHMKVEMDPEFIGKNVLNERPNAVGLNLSYALDKPMGNLAISANLGQFDSKPAFIQQTLVQSFGELTPMDEEGFKKWLEEAHDTAETSFQVFCKGDLMKQFCGQ